ncbi:MAG: hypothetical protein ABL918_12215 [Chakrabartia sp.]
MADPNIGQLLDDFDMTISSYERSKEALAARNWNKSIDYSEAE